MIIYFNDGGKLTCEEITINGNTIYADDIYEVNVCDVDHIAD